MTALKDTDGLHVLKLVEFERDGICFLCDPEGPNPVTTDGRGAFLMRLAARQVPVAEITRQ